MSVSVVKFRPICGISYRTLHTSVLIRSADKTHYEILEVSPTCSTKEIRNAFIQLSKKYHPDANHVSSHSTHAEFIKINEAYSILSKPDKRQEYDFNLDNRATEARNNWEAYTHTPKEKPWRDETIWHMRDQSEDGKYKEKPYYGIKGIRRISNTWIVITCFVFTALGVGLQIAAIRKSFLSSREILDQRSSELSRAHQAIRHQAEINGNKRQIDLLQRKLQPTATD